MASPETTSTDGAKDATVKQSGDNRRAGDADGNRSAGDSKSPGADDPADGSAAEKKSSHKR